MADLGQIWSSGNGFTQGFGNGYWNPIDFLLPGFSILSNATDLTGSTAAQNQFNSQMMLNLQNQAYNEKMAQDQRAWEEKMSATEIQRRVKDLEAAGLNPWLALGQLGGASTPSGASAQTSPGSADMANNKVAAAAGVIAMVLRVLLAKH